MRSVDSCGALLQYHFPLVRTVDAFGTENGLPSTADTAFGDAHIVIAIPFVDFRSLGYGTRIDRSAFVEQLRAVFAHTMNNNRACPVEAMA